MKKLLKPQLLILLLLVLTGCSTTNFNQLPYTTHPDHGYTPLNPLTLNASFEEVASRKTAEFIDCLRSTRGEKLVIADKTKVPNPSYNKPKMVLYNWITGEQINQGNGRFLIKYQLQTETGNDTLYLYVNHFVRGQLEVPHSLVLAEETGGQSIVSGK